MQTPNVHFFLSAVAISLGVTFGGMVTTAVTGKHVELMLGGIVSLSACGAAAGYCQARAELEHSRELEARRLARLSA